MPHDPQSVIRAMMAIAYPTIVVRDEDSTRFKIAVRPRRRIDRAKGVVPKRGLQSSDCCGGESSTTGLPGAGTVQCQKSAGAVMGTCGSAQICTAQGGSCHYKESYYCSISPPAPSTCCSETGSFGKCLTGSDGVLRCNGFDAAGCAGSQAGDKCSLCMLDSTGIPRCNGLSSCVAPGGFCSNSLDCCNGVPCSADATGALPCLQ